MNKRSKVMSHCIKSNIFKQPVLTEISIYKKIVKWLEKISIFDILCGTMEKCYELCK